MDEARRITSNIAKLPTLLYRAAETIPELGRVPALSLAGWETFWGCFAGRVADDSCLAAKRASMRNHSALRANAARCGGGTIWSAAHLS